METLSATTKPAALELAFLETPFGEYSNITDYYNIAGPDYAAWSPHFNMHFGYCKRFSDIFSLEKMLYRMNDEVLNRLNIPINTTSNIVDLGCGVGTVARYAAKKYPLAKLIDLVINNGNTGKFCQWIFFCSIPGYCTNTTAKVNDITGCIDGDI